MTNTSTPSLNATITNTTIANGTSTSSQGEGTAMAVGLAIVVFVVGLVVFMMLRRVCKDEIDACVNCMYDIREDLQEASVRLRRQVSTLGSHSAPRSDPNQGVALRESSDSDGEGSAHNPSVEASADNNPENSSGNEHSSAPADAPESIIVCARVSAPNSGGAFWRRSVI